jgi:hypothetical protein
VLWFLPDHLRYAHHTDQTTPHSTSTGVQGNLLLRDGIWREHNGRCLTCLDVEWRANSRALRVVLPAVKVRKKLSKLALKVRTSPVRSRIIAQDMLDFPQPL